MRSVVASCLLLPAIAQQVARIRGRFDQAKSLRRSGRIDATLARRTAGVRKFRASA
jgi:hypothetical protein